MNLQHANQPYAIGNAVCRIKASDLLVRALKNEGVEYVFGMPGEENLKGAFRAGDVHVVEVPVDDAQNKRVLIDELTERICVP